MKSALLYAIIGAFVSGVVVFMVMRDKYSTKDSEFSVKELAIAE